MSQDAVYFNVWFSACYMRLRERLSYYDLDEDAFHDTYLLVREKALCSVGGHRRLRSLFPRLLPPCRTAQAPHPAARCPSRHGFLSAAVRRRPYGSGRRTRSLRAAGAGHSGVHTPQLPARGLPPLPAALLRVPSSVQLPPAGAVCRDDTLAGRPRGEGRRAGRARKPTFRTAKP